MEKVVLGGYVERGLALSHLLFIDDVIFLCLIYGRDFHTLKEVFQLLKKATGMEVNNEK